MAIKIGLDAGHGLYTAGKQTPDGIKEWTLNDKVRDKVVAMLSDYDCEFVHVDNNEGNTDEALASRLSKYLNAGVKAFVSIHHNAFTGSWNNATGVEVWTDRNATASDTKLAESIYKRLVANTGLKGRGIKKEDFAVINQNKIPAVLIEGGFMDSSIDYKTITSDSGQTAYAKAVAEGLIEFLGLKKKTKTEVDDMLYKVQVGAFQNKSGAEKLLAELKAKGYNGFIVEVDDGAPAATPAPATKPTPTVAVGSTVRVKQGAKTYDGKNLASFVYNRDHKVSGLNGDRAVIVYNNTVVAAVKVSDLILV